MPRTTSGFSPRRWCAVGGLIALAIAGPVGAQTLPDTLPGWFDLSVPGGITTLEALDIAADERALTLPILARALHDRDARIGLTEQRLSAALASAVAPATGGNVARDEVTVPAPLDARTWEQLLPQSEERHLFRRIVADRSALILAAGLMTTDDSVRAWLQRDRDLLRFLYRNGAGGFLVAARRLRIAGDRIASPGGPGAESVWRALAGEPLARPAPFLRALVTKDLGRLAWYYDTIAGLDPDRLAAAWPAGDRLAAATALYASFRDSDPQWRLPEQPFRRSLIDAWTVVTQTEVTAAGPVSALPQDLWSLLFSADRVGVEQAARVLKQSTAPVTLPWLTREIATASGRERRPRFEMFRLAQRVFTHVPPADRATAAATISALKDCRALLFALERMEIVSPSTWWAAVTAARHVAERSENRREALTALQGALALIERLRHVRTLDTATADRLLQSLGAAVRADNRVTRSLGAWIGGELVPALAPPVREAIATEPDYESIILQALGGRSLAASQVPPRRLEWEGLVYTVDLAAAEHDRLRAVRELLPSPGLDAAIAGGRPRELADALLTLVYATALGDPEGAASLSPDVVTRHDFGHTSTPVVRDELLWAPPDERQGFGPWRIQGSLLGLDLGLSRLAMRRIADEQMPAAPSLTLNDLGTLSRTVVALVPTELSDAARDELAAAIARGRERVRHAGTDLAAIGALADEVRMSDTVRQLLPWMLSRQSGALPPLFSLGELLWLGQPKLTRAQLDRWGLAADGLDGRRLTAMPPPAPWEDFAGRSEAGQVTTQVPDLTLRLVEATAGLGLPGSLVPALLAFALEDYWHDTRARFADDWPRLTRQAAELPETRVEDYVAALTGSGPLRAQ